MTGYRGVQLLFLWATIKVAIAREWIVPIEGMITVADIALIASLPLLAAAFLSRLLLAIKVACAKLPAAFRELAVWRSALAQQEAEELETLRRLKD